MKRKKKRSKSISKVDLKVAVVTDPILKKGEIHRQLKYILKTFPNAEIFTPYYESKTIDKPISEYEIHDTFLQLLIPEDNQNEFWLKMEQFAYRTFNFKKFDLVISISSRCARFVKPKKDFKHIGIVINPRRLFSKERLFKKEKKALENMDQILTISNFEKNRLKKIYSIDSDVIYPPIETDQFKPKKILHNKENWFLSKADIPISSLRLLIKAVVEAQTPLKIIGDTQQGVDEEELVKKLKARGFVKFLGKISDKEKVDLMQRCRAYIYPVKGTKFSKEIIEANGAGSVVIMCKKNPFVEYISTEHPQTGTTFDKYSYKSLAETLKNFEDKKYESKNCIMKAQEFDLTIYMYKLKTYIEDAIQNT
jgi:glycosyltransferase involved in cell wall biosynthesis